MFYCSIFYILLYIVSIVYSSLDVFYTTKCTFFVTLHSMLHVRLSYVRINYTTSVYYATICGNCVWSVT